jgi:hypothetical protein
VLGGAALWDEGLILERLARAAAESPDLTPRSLGRAAIDGPKVVRRHGSPATPHTPKVVLRPRGRNTRIRHADDAGRFTLISSGKERPVCSEKTKACWARNRRDAFLTKPR